MFCWYYQWKISKLADENYVVLSHEVAEHLKRCSACRRFYHLCRGMEQRNDLSSITPQAALDIQRKIMQRLHSESDGQNKKAASYRKVWSIAAVLILLAFPAIVAWMVSADIDRMLKKETVDVSGLTRLSEVVRQRWMDERAMTAPAERYVMQSYQKQLQEMTQSGKQAAAFMFACLDPGLQISDTPSSQETVFSQ
jgi:hypothetical protein